MPKFVIEREIPGIETFSDAQVKAISEKSRSVLQEMGPSIQWLHSRSGRQCHHGHSTRRAPMPG